MIKAHGGSKNIVGSKGEGIVLGGILKDTMMNAPRDIKEKHLDRLITQTTGLPREKPIMEGVIDSTVPKHMKAVPEYHKIATHEVGKTKAKRMGQVPYAGKQY
jgi:hypothetical protein